MLFQKLLAFPFILSTLILSSTADDQQHVETEQAFCGNPNHASFLYRVFNPTSMDRFYTITYFEMRNAVSEMGYELEGITGRIFSYRAAGTEPFFCLYNPNTHDHLYTTSETEKQTTIEDLHYTDRGILGFVYTDSSCDGIPLYRLSSHSGTHHLYTTNATERKDAENNMGYNDEGVAAFILPASPAAGFEVELSSIMITV